MLFNALSEVLWKIKTLEASSVAEFTVKPRENGHWTAKQWKTMYVTLENFWLTKHFTVDRLRLTNDLPVYVSHF